MFIHPLDLFLIFVENHVSLNLQCRRQFTSIQAEFFGSNHEFVHFLSIRYSFLVHFLNSIHDVNVDIFIVFLNDLSSSCSLTPSLLEPLLGNWMEDVCWLIPLVKYSLESENHCKMLPLVSNNHRMTKNL